MSQISYGSITIVDVTDIGQFSVYPRADASKTQIYNPDANSYIPNWDTSSGSGGTKVTITPVAYYAGRNVTTSATYTWQRRNGGGAASSLITGQTVVGNTLEISKNVLAEATGGLITYVCTAHYTVDDVVLQAIGQIDFSLVRQGSAAKVAKITGDNVFKINSSGNYLNTQIVLNATVNNTSISAWKYYSPGTTGADAAGYVTYPNSGISTSLTINNTDAPVVAAAGENGNGMVKIKLVTTDSNTYDIFTISILKDGTNAQSSIAAVLSNEVQMLPANDDGTLIGSLTGTSTQLTIYEQGQVKTSEWTITKTPSSGITLAANEANNIATITAINQNVLNGYVTFTCSKTGFPTFTKEFNIVKITAGADGITPTLYFLQASQPVVNEKYTYNGDNVSVSRTPTSVRFSAFKKEGDNPKETFSEGRIQFYVNGSSQISNTLNENRQYRDYDFNSNSSTTKVKAVLYAAGSNTTELDSQTVIVVNDGSRGIQGQDGPAGIDAVNLIIKNEADVIPCDKDGHPFQNFSITIPFEGYQGTTKKATSVTAPNLNSSIWGTTNNITPTITNATSSAPGSVVYTIPTTATVPESGSISLNFSIAAEGGNVLINNRLYTWTRSKAAENGQNAIILQVLTPEGTIFENGSGTLTIKGLLYDGVSEASNVTYKYYRYSSGNYVEQTATSGNVRIVTQGGSKVLKVNGAAVDGYASFRIRAYYPAITGTPTDNNPHWDQYVSLIDKTDPLQVSVHSTIGTQIKNAQGVGCLYVRVTRDGTEIDPVPSNIVASITEPSGSNGDYYIKLTKPTQNNPTGSAQLMKHNGSDWVAQTSRCSYAWTYRNVNNVPLGNSDTKPAASGQFVYIDGTLIQNKITADVEVTLNESSS